MGFATITSDGMVRGDTVNRRGKRSKSRGRKSTKSYESEAGRATTDAAALDGAEQELRQARDRRHSQSRRDKSRGRKSAKSYESEAGIETTNDNNALDGAEQELQQARERRRSRSRRGGRRRSSMGAPTPASSSNKSTKPEDEIEIETSFSTLSSMTQELLSAPEWAENREQLQEACNRRNHGGELQTKADGGEQELQEARHRRNQTIMRLKIDTLEKNIVIAENDRREHERTKRQKLELELEVQQTHEELILQEGLLLSKEAEVAYLTGQLSNLQKETPRLRELEILLEASEDKNKELADRHGAEKNAREDSERRCLELEQQLKAANEKTKEIANERTCDRMAKEHAEARCLELESRLKASHEKNQELAALLRQKSSRIQSMDQSLDDTEALREKAREYDYVVRLCDQLEKKVSATILANEELAREKESLSGEISELNTSIFDAELEREVQAEEIQSAHKQIQSLVTQCQSFEIESNILKQTNMTVTEEKKSLTKKISELNTGIVHAKNDCKVGTNELQNVRRENKVLTEQHKSLKTTLNGLQDTNLVITEEKKSLTKRFTELNASILRSELKHKAQTTELEHVQNQNELLASRCKSLEAELNIVSENKPECEVEKEELQNLQKQNEFLTSRCKSLETELNDTKDKTAIVTKKQEESSNNQTNQSIRSEDETRAILIEQDLERIVTKTNETELNEDIDDYALGALKKGAMDICYIKKYYNAMKDDFTYLPSVARTCLDYSLLEASETFYFEEEDEYPADVFAALRSVAADILQEDGGDDTDEEIAAMLAVSVYPELADELSGDGSASIARTAAEAATKDDTTVPDEPSEEESATCNVPEVEPRPPKNLQQSFLKNTTSSINRPASTTPSIMDRIGKFQTGSVNPKSTGSAREKTSNGKPVERSTDRIRDIETGGKENGNASRRGSLKDRIGKFQTDGGANAIPNSFQTIGLATLGLKNVVADSPNKKDDDSASVSSFHCCNDSSSESSMGDSSASDFSRSEYESSDDDSIIDKELDSVIRVIGPDLALIDIPLNSPSEKIGNMKLIVAEAAGIPIGDLRLGLHSEDNDDEEIYRTALEDDFEVTPGDILAVVPSTVVVYLDGDSKLELSVFPGTLVSDIKEYIEENTGTTPLNQLLYNFDDNLNNELDDDAPISADCNLRLSVQLG